MVFFPDLLPSCDRERCEMPPIASPSAQMVAVEGIAGVRSVGGRVVRWAGEL